MSPMSATIPSVSALEAPMRTPSSAKKYGMKRSATAVLDRGEALRLPFVQQQRQTALNPQPKTLKP